MDDLLDVNAWKKKLSHFVEERNWHSNHTIKNLVMNLCGEAAELMEIFTWDSEDSAEIRHLDPKISEHIQQEMGDVLMTLIMIAEKLNINLSTALAEKLILTSKKYPVK